jgi:hypothetical protein
MSDPEQQPETFVAVPIALWTQAVTLIGKELTIEKGVDVWQGLVQCKKFTGNPSTTPQPKPDAPPTEKG